VAERMAAEQHKIEIDAEWKKIAQVIRKALPIEGMTLHENIKGEFNEMPTPGIIYAVDCQIDPSRFEMMKHPPENGRSMVGVIRVHLQLNTDPEKEAGPSWKVFYYTVWINGQSKTFEHPYEAFLATFEEIRA
jgi:hypothetical protein